MSPAYLVEQPTTEVEAGPFKPMCQGRSASPAETAPKLLPMGQIQAAQEADPTLEAMRHMTAVSEGNVLDARRGEGR